MSLPTVTTSSYATMVNTMRGHISNGTQASATEMQLAIAVAWDAITQLNALQTYITGMSAGADKTALQAALTNNPTAPATSTVADG